MSYVYEKCCESAGIDLKEVERIAKGLSRYGKQAQKLGFTIFGGSGSGSIRLYNCDSPCGRPLVLAEIDGRFDGGDGACWEDENGLMRGE